MSISPSVLRPCDHMVVEKMNSYGCIEMHRSSSELNVDIVPANNKVLRIDRVFSDSKEYFENIHYRQNTNPNIVEWIKDSSDIPSLNDKYHVQCAYIRTTVVKYSATECIRCCGNGWYADLFESEDKMKEVSDIEKLLQSFIKALFTDRSEDGYGTNIKDIVGRSDNDPNIASDIMKSLRQAEESIKNRHQDNIVNGVYTTPGELLAKIEVEKIVFVRDEQTFYVTVRLTSEAGTTASFSFKS
ncbi:MAG: hypothetical protein ACRCX2_13050 [Paraclostridium sp.]